MKFIKRFFAKKYTQDEVKAILAKLSDGNADSLLQGLESRYLVMMAISQVGNR